MTAMASSELREQFAQFRKSPQAELVLELRRRRAAELLGQVECNYGISGVVQFGGELDGVEFLGPIDFDTLEKMCGPFSSREEAVDAVATRLLACAALLSGMWGPSERDDDSR